MLESMVRADFVPTINWISKTEAQVDKHWHSARAPLMAKLMLCYGKFSYTPQKLWMNMFKNIARFK